MTDVPQQDWPAYDAMTRAEGVEWLQGLSTQDRFALYEDMFNVIWNARAELDNWERLDRWNWDQKLATRMRLVEAFTKLDQIRRERTAAGYSH